MLSTTTIIIINEIINSCIQGNLYKLNDLLSSLTKFRK